MGARTYFTASVRNVFKNKLELEDAIEEKKEELAKARENLFYLVGNTEILKQLNEYKDEAADTSYWSYNHVKELIDEIQEVSSEITLLEQLYYNWETKEDDI